MLKINRKVSVVISLVLTVIMFAAVVALAFILPTFTDYLIGLPDRTGERLALTDTQKTLIHAASYGEVAIMLIGLGMLFALLILVQKGKVFTPAAVMLIRYISWCLILMGVILISMVFFFTLAPFVGVAIMFLGLTIRVVKNVIEEAVFLKEENDLTV